MLEGEGCVAVAIERLEKSPNRFPWPPELAELLGQIPDHELARKAGVHAKTVAKERKGRGIPPCKVARPSAEWTPEMIAKLGTDSDKCVADELGLHVATVNRKRRILGISPAD